MRSIFAFLSRLLLCMINRRAEDKRALGYYKDTP